MAMTIELSPKIEQQIREIAKSKGLDPEEIAKRIFEHLVEILTEGLERRLHVARAIVAYSTNEQPSEEEKAALLALLESSLAAAEAHSAELQRLKRIDSLYGRFADLPTTVDEFLRQKHEETAREEAR